MRNRRLRHPDTEETRMALHEAGHLIAAWCCSSVSRINNVTIRTSDGEVRYTIPDVWTPDLLWCNTVISLAGLAAEMLVYQHARSGDCRKDLNQALEFACRLAPQCYAKKAFPIEPDLSICQLYSCRLSSDEQHILGAAYAKAKTILTRMEGPHLRVVSMLLLHRHLTEDMLAKELGTRGFIQAFASAKFILPKTPVRGESVKAPNWFDRARSWLGQLFKI